MKRETSKFVISELPCAVRGCDEQSEHGHIWERIGLIRRRWVPGAAFRLSALEQWARAFQRASEAMSKAFVDGLTRFYEQMNRREPIEDRASD